MQEKILKSLYDIHSSILEVESFFEDRPKQFDEYRKSLLLKRAIERNLEIIGEAMNRILREDPEIENAYRIVGLRNKIIHGYDAVSDENIWAVVVNHLPKLKTEVEKLIRE
jgi:uncharacterized protein with HEPN domain